MKILSVELENLNSLVGRTKIDFTDPAFASGGLFAIVGPTGSGKTTILDAICLALYGRTPRLDKLSKSENEIMSRHAASCFAEVVFEAGRQGRFLCRWEQRRARNRPSGKLQDVKHRICEPGETDSLWKPLDVKSSAVDKVVEEKTGMSFDRFTRSMLLAQGEFAKFLQSDAGRRAEILEQITGTEIYGDISIKVHERNRIEKEKLERLGKELESFDVPEADDPESLRRDIDRLRTAELGARRRLQAVGDLLHRLDRVEQLVETGKKTEDEQRRFEESAKEFEFDVKRLAAACAALEIEPFYSELVLHRRRLETVGRSLAETRRSLPETETALQQAARLESESETAWRQTEQCRDVGLKTIAEVERLDVVLAETDRTVASLEQKIAEHAAEQSSRLEQIGGLEGELATLLSGQTVADLEAAIRKRETATESKRDGRDFAEIIGLRDESAKQLRLWELLRESLEGREQTETEITEWGKRQARLERDREALQSEEKELAGKKERAAETLERLEERLEWLGRIASLEEQRRRLEDGKPCPLCGALEHPYASQAEPAPDETANERDAAKRLLHEIEKAIGGTGVRRAILEQELRRMQRDTETAAKRLDERNRRIAETVAELGLSETPRIDEITARREEIDRQREQLSQTLIDLERMRAETERFRQCLQDAQKIVSQIETRRILVASREKELESAQGELAERTAGREKTLEERQRLFGDKEIDPEKKRLEEQLQTARETWTGRRESCREAAVRLNNLRQRLESETRAEQEAGQTVRAASDDFDKRLQAAEFASESEFVAARLEPDRRKALEEAEQRRNDRLRELRTLREENAAALNALRAESPKRCPSRESLVSVRESRQARLGELGERIGELRQRLENVRDLDERRKSLADERKKALATGRLWGTLHRLIGSADGKKYRAFAQALTFRILIDEANRQLEKMTGRYLLIPNDDSDKALDLSVLDADQGGAVRSTKNLSGGECFLVSLALALGLSSMSGSRTRVDSLFLDEGFGTLDEQTLETALSVLERLRSDEKQIGVISHVPAIRDRIAVQIRVKPKKRGQSVVEIVTGS